MKVLITGAAGVLGSTVTAMLGAEGGFEIRLTDLVPLETTYEFVQADLAQWEQAQGLCAGIDQVLHIAAVHLWKEYTAAQYIDCNIKGTYHLLQAAAEAGVQRVIYTSSTSAMGYTANCPEELPFDESKPCQPGNDIYSISKRVGEQFCEMFRYESGLDCLMLRPGCFVPHEEEDASFWLGLLTACVHHEDVARAHVLALKSAVKNEAIIITAKTPFTPADTQALLTDAPPVILKYYPQAIRLKELGIELPQHLSCFYNIEKAEKLLGYHPEFNFEQWLAKMLSR